MDYLCKLEALDLYLTKQQEYYMKLIIGVFMITSLLLLTNCSKEQGAAEKNQTGLTRDQVDAKYKWNLEDIYKDEAAWRSAKADVEKMLPKLKTYKGKLGRSANTLYNCLDFSSKVTKEYMRLASYAGKLSDQDTRESGPMAMNQEIAQLGTKLNGAHHLSIPKFYPFPNKPLNAS